jgi:hypothetical protein
MPAPSEEFIRRQRELKAMELEEIAIAEGVTSARLADEDVRKRLRVALAKRRGKPLSQVTVSLDTWRVLWRFMHDRETHGQAGEPPVMDRSAQDG